MNPAKAISAEPEVREANGSWLAVSPSGDRYRIGVMGDTEEDARRKYASARRRQIAAHNAPHRLPTR